HEVMSYKAEKIISWKKSYPDNKIYILIKYKHYAYNQCEWVTYDKMLFNFPQLLTEFESKFDISEPAPLNYEKVPENLPEALKEIVLHGVKLEWLKPERIIGE
ncbi:MAG: hypothetical protein MHPSP_003792, partial [Paramarteilia canceri]